MSPFNKDNNSDQRQADGAIGARRVTNLFNNTSMDTAFSDTLSGATKEGPVSQRKELSRSITFRLATMS